MKKQTAVSLFDSLASPNRLDIYRLLVKSGPDGMVAGDIASTLKIPANNASFHLKTLAQSKLLSVQQEGRFQRYRANMALMNELISYLTAECCAGSPEKCLGMTPVARKARSKST